MYLRVKRTGSYAYLQIVESFREKGQVRQRVLSTVGRLDTLQASGQLDTLMRSGLRFCEKLAVIDAHAAGQTEPVQVQRVGPDLVFSRLWEALKLGTILKRALQSRRYEFDVERAVYLTVVHRLFASGSDRAAERWREAYRLPGTETLELHHLYRAMAFLGEPLKDQPGARILETPRCTKDWIEEELFEQWRDLFSEIDLVFFDTTSIYFEGEGGQEIGRHGKSKDHRPDLKQMVVGLALDLHGWPLCCELWPGNTADVADVRTLDLSPRSFRTRFGGLFFFVPLLHPIDLAAVTREAKLPGSKLIPAQQALRSLLALKLIGKERKSHVMDLVFDPGLAVFAGLNVIPKRSYLAAYSSKIDHQADLRLMAAWSTQVHAAGLPRGDSFDLDFHTIPANTQEEPLEKHYVSSRSRRQQGILVFLARDATERVLCYGNAGLSKAEQPDEILRFVEFWQARTGKPPAELVFDSQLTTYTHLHQLNQLGIGFMTLRRRSKKMLGQIWSRPASAWRRITLPSLTRTFRTPKVLDQLISLPGYSGTLRQITITELGHEEPTVLLTNQSQRSCPNLVTRYAHRVLIENGISEAIQFFHLDALSAMVGLKVDFDLQITLMASSLYRLLAAKVGREYERAQAKKLFRNLLDVSATVTIDEARVHVTLDKRAHNPFLVASGLANQSVPMPWFGNKKLLIDFA